MAGFVHDHLLRIQQPGETLDLSTMPVEVVAVEAGTITMLRLVPKEV